MKRIYLAFILFMLLITATGCGTKSINLNDYMSVSVSGFDGYGAAKAVFDESALRNELNKMIGDVGSSQKERIINSAVSKIKWKIDNQSFLSNGTKVLLIWDVAKEVIKEEAGIVFTCSDMEVVVKNLSEPDIYDIAADIEIITDGYSDWGTIAVDLSKSKTPGLNVGINKTERLSNGDIIELSFSSPIGKETTDSYTIDKYGCKLKQKTIQYEVQGLKELSVYDYFERIKVRYVGVEPVGRIDIDTSGVDIPDIAYEVDKTNYLKNGDVVTITVKTDSAVDINRILAQYGYKIGNKEMKYTVEGLSSYNFSFSENEHTDLLNKMDQQAQDALQSRLAKGELTTNPNGIKSITLFGYYFLQEKPLFVDRLTTTDMFNKLVLVYVIEAEQINTNGNVENFEYYYYTEFSNIVKETDGSLSCNIASYNVPEGGFGYFYSGQVFTKESTNYNCLYLGFETLDELYSSQVAAYLEKYSYETNIE